MPVPATDGVLRSNISTMQIGDYIRCGYNAAAAKVGYFHSFGDTSEGNEIPITGTDNPSGFFYFIKAADHLLIADRVIQTGISWLTVNNSGYIHGTWLDTIVPKMTSNTVPAGIASASSIYSTSYNAWKAFNQTVDSEGWVSKAGEPTGWLEFEFSNTERIVSYTLRCPTVNPNQMASEWTIESWDGASWIVLDSRSATGWKAKEERTYHFANTSAYKRYRLNIKKNSGHASYTGVDEWKLRPEEKRIIFRSLLGGIAYADLDGKPYYSNKNQGGYPIFNEWDTYIVNSNLGGKIAAGDRGIWNWGTGSFCQETPQTGLVHINPGVTAKGGTTYRMVRGYVVGSTTWFKEPYFELSSSTFTYVGFRPVIEFK